MKRLLKLFTVIAVLAGIVAGIQYLEDMRERSAAETRANNAAALEAAREAQENAGHPRLEQQ